MQIGTLKKWILAAFVVGSYAYTGQAAAQTASETSVEVHQEAYIARDNAARWDFGFNQNYTQGTLKIQGQPYTLRGISNMFMLRWRRLPVYLTVDIGYMFGGGSVASALGYKQTQVLYADPKFGFYRMFNMNDTWRIVPRLGLGSTVFRPFLGVAPTQSNPGIAAYGDMSIGGGVSLETRKPVWNGGKFRFNLKYNKIFVQGTSVALGTPGTDSFGQHVTAGIGFVWSIGEDPAFAKRERDEARSELASTGKELTGLAANTSDPELAKELDHILQRVVTLQNHLDASPGDYDKYGREIEGYRRRAAELHVDYIRKTTQRRQALASGSEVSTPAKTGTVAISRTTVINSYLNAINSRSGAMDDRILTPPMVSYTQKQLATLNRFSKVHAQIYSTNPDGYDVAISYAIDGAISTRSLEYSWIQRLTFENSKIHQIRYVPDSASYQNNVVNPFPSDPRTLAIRNDVLHIIEPLRVAMEQGTAGPLVDYLGDGTRIDVYELSGGINKFQQSIGKQTFVKYLQQYLSGGHNLISVIDIKPNSDKDVEVDLLLRQFDRGILQKILARTSGKMDEQDDEITVRKVIASLKLKRSGNTWTVADASWRSRNGVLDDEALWPKIITALGDR
jgi:hypothetical protein